MDFQHRPALATWRPPERVLAWLFGGCEEWRPLALLHQTCGGASSTRQRAVGDSYLTQGLLLAKLNHIQFIPSRCGGESDMKPAAAHAGVDFYRTRSVQGLGQAVASLRADRGMTQAELGATIDSSRPTISRLENGADVSMSTVVESLTALGYEIVLVPRGAQIALTSIE